MEEGRLGTAEGQVSCEITTFRNQANELRDAVQQLESRLVAVLTENAKEPPTAAGEAQVSLVPLANEAREINLTFRTCLKDIGSILERLQV